MVPAYNESGAIAAVVQSLHEHAPDFDVLVVDDGSTDDTGVNAAIAGAAVVRLPFNLGIGGAVQSGFVYAREHDYDYMAQVDGDGQHDPVELIKLVHRMDTEPAVDVVCGSRFVSDDYRYPAPISRRTGIHLFAFALTRILRQRISDPTSGFRLYNRRAIALFARDYPHDYPEVEAILMVHANRLSLTEVPVRMFVREIGRSSITKPRSFYYMVKVSLALIAGLLRRRVVDREWRVGPRLERALMNGSRVQIVSIAFAVVVLFGVFELVRQRRLRERYALVWMGAALVLLILAIWKNLLADLSHAVGIATPSNALFVVAFAFVLLLLLNFSVSVSRLADQTRVLAQRLALTEERLRRVEEAQGEAESGADRDRDRLASPR